MTDGSPAFDAARVTHSNDDYDEAGFTLLRDMEARHFWYRGRYRFLLHAVRETVHQRGGSAIDIGGGCGGWIAYLRRHAPDIFGELALADSSPRALELAAPALDGFAARHHTDVLALPWHDRWDAVFLLDVIEHVADDRSVLRQVRRSLRPNGLLFLTAPALSAFWSHNDDLAGHKRRYSRRTIAALAEETHFAVERVRYFMFFLSPALWASRLRHVDIDRMSAMERRRLVEQTHRVPAAPLNAALGLVFAAETPLGWVLPFPWGTSVLAVLRKQEDM